ncbi:histone deacetylase family protein [Thalassoroseus pseudoceratinae]|uniref:histone deacetylase family protein n=1 Tax=Thalassoroseus pseudoceratinae TaxID=2713176 RepID=UPI00142355B5|nr:histone deacetylase [Thalassoroseus pseudoceratinae]
MTVRLFTDDFFLEHETGEHPERPARLSSITKKLTNEGLIERCERGKIRFATDEELLRNHTESHLKTIADTARRTKGYLEADTPFSAKSADVARQAAGTAIEAVDAVFSDDCNRALALIRPPGHHARPSHVMGFCLYNNVAVAARHAIAKQEVERILIVDWDVHHGNGTQDSFYHKEQVTFFSAHRSPFYPGTGAADETGSGPGLGHTLNLPLRFGISRKEYCEAFANSLADAVRKSRPQLILLSAGFDAHAADPIGSLSLEAEDFGTLTQMLTDVADSECEGRLVSLLEGGYNLDALAESVACHLGTLLDEPK